jgi:hypothetical protein
MAPPIVRARPLHVTLLLVQSSTQFGQPPKPLAHRWQRSPSNPRRQTHMHASLVASGLPAGTRHTASARSLHETAFELQLSMHGKEDAPSRRAATVGVAGTLA